MLILMAQHGSRTLHLGWGYMNPRLSGAMGQWMATKRKSVGGGGSRKWKCVIPGLVGSGSQKRNNKVFIKRKQMVKYLVGCQLVACRLSPCIIVSLRIARLAQAEVSIYSAEQQRHHHNERMHEWCGVAVSAARVCVRVCIGKSF